VPEDLGDSTPLLAAKFARVGSVDDSSHQGSFAFEDGTQQKTIPARFLDVKRSGTADMLNVGDAKNPPSVAAFTDPVDATRGAGLYG